MQSQLSPWRSKRGFALVFICFLPVVGQVFVECFVVPCSDCLFKIPINKACINATRN